MKRATTILGTAGLGVLLSLSAASLTLAVTLEEMRTGGASAVQTVSSAPITGAPDELYLAAIVVKRRVPVTSVEGLGLEWTLVDRQCSGVKDQTGVEIWMAMGAPTGSGSVTATLSETQRNATIAVSRYSGVDKNVPLGNVVSANNNGIDGDCFFGSKTSSYSFPLATTGDASVVYSAAAIRQRSHEPGLGFVETLETSTGTSGDAAGLAVQERPVATPGIVTVAGTFSSEIEWAVVAVEIRNEVLPVEEFRLWVNYSGPGSGEVVLDPPGGIYRSGTEVRVTASEYPGSVFVGYAGDLSGFASTRTITVDADKKITATFLLIPLGHQALKVMVRGDVGGTASPYGISFHPTDSVVRLDATPDPDFEFTGWSGALVSNFNPATITMNATKEVFASFAPVATACEILHEETVTGISAGVSSATSAPITAAADQLYLAAVSSKKTREVISVTGLGLDWTRVSAQCAAQGDETSVEIWSAIGTPTASGPVTATLIEPTTSISMTVSRYSGVDPVTPIGSVVAGNTNGPAGDCELGTRTDFYSFPINLTAEGSVLFSAAATRQRQHEPGLGYVELAEVQSESGGDASGVAVQEQLPTPTSTAVVSGSFSKAFSWAVVGLEIRCSSAPQPRNGGSTLEVTPADLRLTSFPNPFVSTTSIHFTLPVASPVAVKVYDVTGRLVRSLEAAGVEPAGDSRLVWDGRDRAGRQLASGVYFARLEWLGGTRTHKLILAR